MSFSNGDPKQEATPIFGEIRRAVVQSATKSPTLFPMAMMVKPKIDVEIDSIRPKASMIATSKKKEKSYDEKRDTNTAGGVGRPTSLGDNEPMGIACHEQTDELWLFCVTSSFAMISSHMIVEAKAKSTIQT